MIQNGKPLQVEFENIWTDWEQDSFAQCGVKVAVQPDGSYHLSQPDYVEENP